MPDPSPRQARLSATAGRATRSRSSVGQTIRARAAPRPAERSSRGGRAGASESATGREQRRRKAIEASLPRRHPATHRREPREESGWDAIRGSPVTRVICAAGGLVWRVTSRGRRLAVIRRERYGAEWTLPKGKLDPGEEWAEAALREVREETGCEARIESFAGGLTYQHDGRPKIVLFWNMRLVADHGFERSEEVSDLVWLNPQEAVALLTHPDERELVARQPA